MAGNFLSTMTLGKWIGLAVVLAVVGFVLLTRFTSFQIPETLTEDPAAPQAPGGVKSRGSTATENNLDAVNEIIRGTDDETQSEDSADEN